MVFGSPPSLLDAAFGPELQRKPLVLHGPERISATGIDNDPLWTVFAMAAAFVLGIFLSRSGLIGASRWHRRVRALHGRGWRSGHTEFAGSRDRVPGIRLDGPAGERLALALTRPVMRSIPRGPVPASAATGRRVSRAGRR